MKTVEFIKVFYKRLKGETPAFFKFLRRIGGICTAIGGGLIGAKAQFNLEFINTTYFGYAITAGIVIAAVCSLPVVDNKDAQV